MHSDADVQKLLDLIEQQSAALKEHSEAIDRLIVVNDTLQEKLHTANLQLMDYEEKHTSWIRTVQDVKPVYLKELQPNNGWIN
jgi:hypothetical protein